MSWPFFFVFSEAIVILLILFMVITINV
jgi:hypothetical protein